MNFKNLPFILLFGSGLILYACKGKSCKYSTTDSLPVYLPFDSTQLILHPTFSGKDSIWKQDLTDWYRSFGFHLAWFKNGERIEYAEYLLQISRDGQEPADTNLNRKVLEITEKMENLPAPSDSGFIQEALKVEVSLSLLFLNYANQHWVGISEESRQKTGWHIPGIGKKPIQLLSEFLFSSDHSDFQRKVVYSQHGKLEQWLGKYQKIKNSGGWPKIKWPQERLKSGDTASVLTDLRKYLFITGDLSENSELPVLDTTLAVGIRAFQRRHGLYENGIPDLLTIRAMSYSVEDRIRQILINMERCRWVPPEPKGKYLAVNIPDFRLMVFENQQLLWSCRAVVGREKTGTVIFSNQLQTVVFNPYWNIPRSILVNEILPKVRNNSGYLASQNMEVYTSGGTVVPASSINWNEYSGRSFPYNIRQKPGRNNALGKVKFLFPNEHNIYLHDTPAKSLFAEPIRAFSHGCIRIQEPVRLAKELLKGDPEWTEEKIQIAMEGSQETQVKLRESVPVFITYFTSWVDSTGQIHFREDIYKHDSKTGEILFPE